MEKPSNLKVKKDMLSIGSMVQEILRALYFYGADYIVVRSGKREKLIHKEQLVGLLEKGKEKTTLEESFSMDLGEPMSARMQLEDISPRSSLLLFVQTGSGEEGELSLLTFGEYREMKIQENMVIMPDWWNIPLPLVHVDEDRVFLNATALEMIPGGDVLMAKQIERLLSERIVTIKEKNRERTFSLYPLAENTYLAEDISGDFEMAEDLVWWAAIGKAFVNRMKDNGLAVERLSAHETPPEDAAEIISCHWDNELVGRLAIRFPDDDAAVVAEPAVMPEETTEAVEPMLEKKQAAEDERVPEAEKPNTKKKKGASTTPEKKTGSRRKNAKEAPPKPSEADTPAIADADEDIAAETPVAGNSLRKSAAKNAYGMKPSVRAGKSTKDPKNGARKQVAEE